MCYTEKGRLAERARLPLTVARCGRPFSGDFEVVMFTGRKGLCTLHSASGGEHAAAGIVIQSDVVVHLTKDRFGVQRKTEAGDPH